MIDYIAVGKWVQRFVKDAGFDELPFEMEQTMVNEVMQAALGDSLLYEPVYLDGRDTSNAAPHVNGMDWKGRRWGDWVRVWPKVES